MWFYWVWGIGAAFMLLSAIILITSVYVEFKSKYKETKKQNNYAEFMRAILMYLVLAAIPFLNFVFGLCYLFASEDTKQSVINKVLATGRYELR